MSRKRRKNYTPAEKVSVLRQHWLEKTLVSELCDEYHLAPALFYQWQRQFFEQGAA
jgi:transposase